MASKILIVRKMSALEYYYKGNHNDPVLQQCHQSHARSIDEIVRTLQMAGVEFDIITRRELSTAIAEPYDLIISAGGDGTVIATAAFNQDKPQLNLKTDSKSKGSLCCKGLSSPIKDWLGDYFSIQEWTRAETFLNGKFLGRALNEVVIGEQLKVCKMAKYFFRYSDNKRVYEERQENSGLVIATGTGSSAWPALFPPFPRDAKLLRFAAILPAIGDTQQGHAAGLEITYLGHEGKIALDTVEYEFPRNSVLEIKLSEHPLRVVMPK